MSKSSLTDSHDKPASPASFAAISFHKYDQIRLLQFPTEVVDAIRNLIKQNWTEGIQDEKNFAGSYEFKLVGRPWKGDGSDAITSRIIVRELLAHLFSTGWILVTCTDVCTAPYERDTLIFRKKVARPPPTPPSTWVAISFDDRCVLRLIGAPDGLIRAFHELLNNMQDSEYQGWTDRENNVFEFRLSGTPWQPSGKETMSTRLLILRMLETLERFRCFLYASTVQNGERQTQQGPDCWYCFIAPSSPSITADPIFHSNFACVSFHKSNLIRLLQFPPEDVASIRQKWWRGRGREQEYAGSFEFQCHRSPWGREGSALIPSRTIVLELLAHLFSEGWILTTSTKTCMRVSAKDTMVFSKQAAPPPASIWFAISFSNTDRLSLIGAPEDLIQAFQKLLKSLGLLQDEFWKERVQDTYEFKLQGRPFGSNSEGNIMSAKLLMLGMLDTLEKLGWRLYANILHKTGTVSQNTVWTGTDSWYCVRALD